MDFIILSVLFILKSFLLFIFIYVLWSTIEGLVSVADWIANIGTRAEAKKIRLAEEHKVFLVEEAKRLEVERLENAKMERIRMIEEQELKDKIHQANVQRKWNLENSPLTNHFNAVEGGETTLYYLKLKNKFGETRYKIGVTINNVYQRYSSKFHDEFEILYEKKLTHANGIEKAIIKKFQHLVTDEGLIGTTGTEIFREDVLRLGA